jgi:hypothetical protein
MLRYFFHFASKDDFVPDYDGVILDDLKAAHQHAIGLVWQTFPLMRGEDLRHWRLEVADESQLVHLTVLFPAVPPRPPFGRREPTKLDRIPVGPSGGRGHLRR